MTKVVRGLRNDTIGQNGVTKTVNRLGQPD
jgi:hypothetical protein